MNIRSILFLVLTTFFTQSLPPLDPVTEQRPPALEQQPAVSRQPHKPPMQQETFAAKDFFQEIVGETEPFFRDHYWDQSKQCLKNVPLNSVEAFHQWIQSWIAKFPRRQAIFEGQPLLQTLETLNTQISAQGGIIPLGDRKAQFTVLLFDPQNPQKTEITALQAHHNNALFQLASTFYGPLEGGMIHPEASLTNMLPHAVQGEWGSISAAGATIYRKYFMPTFHTILNQTPYFYLLQHVNKALLSSSSHIDINALKQYQYKSQDKLNVGIFTHKDIAVTSWCITNPALKQNATLLSIPLYKNQKITQVLNSALNLKEYYSQLKSGEQPNPNILAFAQMIIAAMYEGTLKSAYLHKKQTVFLTLLGGGAFVNDIAWISNALSNSDLINFIKQSGLKITIIYRPDHPERVKPRTAEQDIQFLSAMYSIADAINNTSHAATIINSTEMQNYYNYIKTCYTPKSTKQRATQSRLIHQIPTTSVIPQIPITPINSTHPAPLLPTDSPPQAIQPLTFMPPITPQPTTPGAVVIQPIMAIPVITQQQNPATSSFASTTSTPTYIPADTSSQQQQYTVNTDNRRPVPRTNKKQRQASLTTQQIQHVTPTAQVKRASKKSTIKKPATIKKQKASIKKMRTQNKKTYKKTGKRRKTKTTPSKRLKKQVIPQQPTTTQKQSIKTEKKSAQQAVPAPKKQSQTQHPSIQSTITPVDKTSTQQTQTGPVQKKKQKKKKNKKTPPKKLLSPPITQVPD